MPDYASMQVFDANGLIIDDLKATTRGEPSGSVMPGTVLLRQETYDHPYPHCWRCKNPLIYKAVSSWFVSVTRFRDRMVELNEQINWVPEHVKDGQFGKWLSNARDWSISRNRYFGSPIPIWKSDDPAYPRVDVYGSIAELEADFGGRGDRPAPAVHRRADPTQPGRPDGPLHHAPGARDPRRLVRLRVDAVRPGALPVRERATGSSTTTRATSSSSTSARPAAGSTPCTSWPPPCSTGRRSAAAISHGIVLGSDGQKMSKSLRNYPDVNEVFDRDGADAMRWFLMSSPILRGGNLIVTEQGIREGVRQVLIPLWNAYYFFTLYANAAQGGRGYEAQVSRGSTDVLDRYILAKLDEFTTQVGDELEALNVAAACDATRSFLEVLSNWYIRRSRDRFWDGESDALAGRLRHPLHGAGADHPGGRAAAAADRGGGLARADRRPLGAPDRLAVGHRRERRRPGGGHGPGPRGVLDRLGAAQGRGAAGPAAVGALSRWSPTTRLRWSRWRG